MSRKLAFVSSSGKLQRSLISIAASETGGKMNN